MCGRFAVSITTDQIEKLIPGISKLDIPKNFNVAPSQSIAALKQGSNEIEFFHWGLIPFWAKDRSISYKMINARAETVHEKPSFKNALKKRRCIIPASGYYEWKKEDDGKQPYYIKPKNDDLFLFAGLWEKWTDKESGEIVESATIITTDATEAIQDVHHRMPAMITKEHVDIWLKEDYQLDELQQLILPNSSIELEFHPVSKMVNKPLNNSPECLKPIND